MSTNKSPWGTFAKGSPVIATPFSYSTDGHRLCLPHGDGDINKTTDQSDPMRAPQHPKNTKRLATLAQFEVLDTAPEADFDDLVDWVAEFLDVPVVLISLVDEHRQWFKARKGLDLAQTPITESVCAHAILGDGILEVEDTRIDARTKHNPLLHEGTPLRFYAGAPLTAPNGLPLGTLCVLDHAPRKLTPFQRRTLVIMATQIVKQLELKRALRNEETMRAEMDHRVKNSLQATASLVRLYGRGVGDEAAREALEAVQRRLDGMSALHEQLQSNSIDGTVQVADYLSELIDNLRKTVPENISLTLRAEDVLMPSTAASDLGVIVSEFVANALKHGFPGNAAGAVDISLAHTDAGKLALHASDTGTGSQHAPAAPSRARGIGSSIVAAAASSLGGAVTTDLTPQGARMTLVFPAP